MRFMLRFVGTWVLGLSLILAIIDGTRSLAASDIVMTPFSGLWVLVHSQSFVGLRELALQSPLAIAWDFLSASLLNWPAFAIFGTFGLLLIFWGRRPSSQIRSLGEY